MVYPRQMFITSLLNETEKQNREVSARWSNKRPLVLSPLSTALTWHIHRQTEVPMWELWDSGSQLWNRAAVQIKESHFQKARSHPGDWLADCGPSLQTWEQFHAPEGSAAAPFGFGSVTVQQRTQEESHLPLPQEMGIQTSNPAVGPEVAWELVHSLSITVQEPLDWPTKFGQTVDTERAL